MAGSGETGYARSAGFPHDGRKNDKPNKGKYGELLRWSQSEEHADVRDIPGALYDDGSAEVYTAWEVFSSPLFSVPLPPTLSRSLGALFMPTYKSDALLLQGERARCVNQDLYRAAAHG